MATFSGIPALPMFPTAVRGKSCGMRPATLARRQAVFQDYRMRVRRSP